MWWHSSLWSQLFNLITSYQTTRRATNSSANYLLFSLTSKQSLREQLKSNKTYFWKSLAFFAFQNDIKHVFEIFSCWSNVKIFTCSMLRENNVQMKQMWNKIWETFTLKTTIIKTFFLSSLFSIHILLFSLFRTSKEWKKEIWKKHKLL